MAEGIAFSFLGKISEFLVAPIGRQFGYVFCYNGNIMKLRREFDKLEAKSRGLRLQVDAAEDNFEVVGPYVELWLNRAEEKMEEANLVLLDKENIGKGCFNECCLYLKQRYLLSRKATKRTQDLIVLLAEGDFQTVAYPPPPMGIVSTSSANNLQSGEASHKASVSNLAIASTSMSSSEGFRSRLSILGEVMEAVRDDHIHTIGICGMGGIGKTTMVEEVAERVRKELLFDEIVMTVVTQQPDEKRIQRSIADFLNLKLEEDDLLARASRLHQRLSKKGSAGKSKKILIILDDLWEKLDLKKVGIPFGDDHSGCKLVLTSRSRDVCTQMKAGNIFFIPVLQHDEALALFKNSIHTATVYQIGEDIVKECCGLPIAITMIAMVLADKEEDTWNYVLGQLKKSSLKGEYADVYKVFQVSYDHIKHEEIKYVFRLCCLYPEDSDIPIEDLVRYGMGLRVFKNVDKLHEARDGAHAHIEVLKNLNMLLDSKKADCIKMHDLVRDFGLSIAAEDKFMVKFDKGLKEWPVVEDKCEGYTSISMQCEEINEFPNGLKYPKLKLLQLTGRDNDSRLFKFPERLDEVMPDLQVLSLKHMSAPSLLGSVERLTNLRTLSLRGCALLNNDVSTIGNIGQLEMLTLADSDISELPKEIGNLRRLRLLDLTWCRKLEKIAPGVLSSLVCLEELYMKERSIRWAEEICATLNDAHEDGGRLTLKGSYARFDELKHLHNLYAIDIDIPNEFLPVDLKLENLKKFKISVGNKWSPKIGVLFYHTFFQKTSSELNYFPYSLFDLPLFHNTLCLSCAEIVPLRSVLKALCRKTEILFLEVNHLKNLGDEVEGEDLIRLKFLIFRSCNELVSVFDGVDQSFSIHTSSLVLRPFGNLRHLELNSCGKLKSIFSVSIANGLFNLESLEISNCSQIEEIISKERGDDEDEKKAVEFLKLKILSFWDLPNLICFCKAVDHEVRLPQLEHMRLRELPKLTSLYPEMETSVDTDDHHGSSTKHPFFHQKVTQKNVAELHIYNLEDLIELWPAKTGDVSSTCTAIRKIWVWSCDRLLRVFASNMIIQQLQSLESLEVKDCRSLEGVYNIQGIVNMNEGCQVELSTQLTHLHLESLPELTHLWGRSPHIICRGFQNLRKLCVVNCHRLKNIFSLSIARSMVMLESVHASCCDTMEAIFLEEEAEDETTAVAEIEFPKLKTLHLECLPSLVGLCRFVDVVVAVPQLQELHLNNLPMVTADLYSGTKNLFSEHPFINQKVALTNLRDLVVKKMGNITTVFPENVIAQLQNLQSIKVHECVKVEVVFDLQGSNLNDGRHQAKAFSQFESISLENLPKLTSIWKNAPSVIQGFQNLREFNVFRCDSLRHLLTPSMAKNLAMLECLHVNHCESLEAIVAEEEGEEATYTIVFPQLRSLELTDLHNLNAFMVTRIIEGLELPLLKELVIKNCHNMKIFCSEVVNVKTNLEEVEVGKDQRMAMGDLNGIIYQWVWLPHFDNFMQHLEE